ncbi:MAG: tetraacyldisaccharide 4'-kinase [Candidatus Eisenbacteria bacterium]|nr:tetraacyldisaccharide 4'-kinase [Candidatus Eisenbacteria bacterium]
MRRLRGWIDAAWGSPPGPAPRGIWLLETAATVYRGCVRLHRPRQQRAPIPVVSVGSLWAGGAGKTPLAMEIARLARIEDLAPAVLLRGYGGSTRRGVREVPGSRAAGDWRIYGDEACLHADAGTARIFVGRSRLDASRRAHQKGCTIAILDDGMQHRRLARDWEIVTLPADLPLGNGRLLPRGPLREDPTALRRASLVIMAHHARAAVAQEEWRPVRALCRPGTPIFSWIPRLEVSLPGGDALGGGATIGLLCGIGRPDLFERALRDAGYAVAMKCVFPDHHPFSQSEIDAVFERARGAGLAAIVTTRKDAVRLAGMETRRGVPLCTAGMTLVWREADAADYIRKRLRELR